MLRSLARCRYFDLLGIFAVVFLLTLTGRTAAQDAPTIPAPEVTMDYTSAAYQKTFGQHIAQGERLLHVSITNQPTPSQPSRVCYKATWSATDGPPWYARHGLSDKQFQKQLDDYKAQGYRPINLCAYTLASTPFFGGLWEMSDGPDWQVHIDLSPADFASEDKSLAGQGYHIEQSCKYMANGKPLILGLWQKVLPADPPH